MEVGGGEVIVDGWEDVVEWWRRCVGKEEEEEE